MALDPRRRTNNISPSHSTQRQNPSQRLTINPSNPGLESLSSSQTSSSTTDGSRAGRPCIKHLSLISGEEGSTLMHPSLPSFLSTLSSLSIFHIAWYSLDWLRLPADQRQALIRLVSLSSLDKLEVVASQNFPLDLLRRFSGTQIHLTFAGTLITRFPISSPTQLQASVNLQALEKLSLVGQRNIVVFMEHSQSHPELCAALRRLEFLSITCIDSDLDRFESQRNLELVGHFLRFLNGPESRIRELRVQDERPNAVIGHFVGHYWQDLLSLRDVKNVEAHLCIKYVESPRDVCSAFRDWFSTLLSGLSLSTCLTSLDITYQVLFSRPPRWLKALIENTGQLWKEFDVHLARRLPRLQQVNLGFQFHGVGGHEQWMEFNAENQPAQLNERGLDCSFWVRDI